ncbi:uncharacterized protein LOC109826582 [Asparagus officinalis]|uniref:uncharacterized protein LOC109826582 n=1 Tax=Asparagus officinalis TaxID=4686 RepID=UPI00098E0624|nr:uncharacterized protein LOC109826582 [Asparagus officinalis]
MVIIPASEQKVWNDYVTANPDAKGYQNRLIENWDDIMVLCAKDRANGEGAETFEEAANTMQHDESVAQSETNEDGSSSRKHLPGTSTSGETSSKKQKKGDKLVDSLAVMAASVTEYFNERKKEVVRKPPTGEEIHHVVSKIPNLSRIQVFKAFEKLMDSNPEKFYLLKSLPDDEKRDFILFILKEQLLGIHSDNSLNRIRFRKCITGFSYMLDLMPVGFVTFFLNSVLDNLTSTIVMVSLLRKLVPPSEYRKYAILTQILRDMKLGALERKEEKT